MTSLEIAVGMYRHQHERWNQWALFFFGSIISVFVLWGQVSAYVPLVVPAILAFVLSILWVLVALSIRQTTRSWLETVLDLEEAAVRGESESSGAFHIFREHEKKFKAREDLTKTLRLYRSEPYRRVTRILTLVGVLSVLVFGLLTAVCIWKGPTFGRPSVNNATKP
jgi:hypothetical protein